MAKQLVHIQESVSSTLIPTTSFLLLDPWLSWLERSVDNGEVTGSSPVGSTIQGGEIYPSPVEGNCLENSQT